MHVGSLWGFGVCCFVCVCFIFLCRFFRSRVFVSFADEPGTPGGLWCGMDCALRRDSLLGAPLSVSTLPTPALTRPCSLGTFLPRTAPPPERTEGREFHRCISQMASTVSRGVSRRWSQVCPERTSRSPEERKAFRFLRGRVSKSDARAARCGKPVRVTLKGKRMRGPRSAGSPASLQVARLVREARGAASSAGARPSRPVPAAPPSPAAGEPRGSHPPRLRPSPWPSFPPSRPLRPAPRRGGARPAPPSARPAAKS